MINERHSIFEYSSSAFADQVYDDDEVTHFQTTTIYNISIQKHGES